MDGLQLLVEEKEVGPEDLPGVDDLSTPGGHTPQDELEKNLNTSEILKCECLGGVYILHRGRADVYI